MDHRSPNELRHLVEAFTMRPGYTSSMGTQVLHVSRGEVHLRVARQAQLLQFNGFFHGGVVTGLADHAAGGAVTTALESGQTAVTLGLQVNFLRPAEGEWLLAKAHAIQTGKTIGVAQVEVYSGDAPQPCALVMVSLRVVPIPRTP